tara:strand:+ start:1028 stop:1240 length:213 start_codon:yes stop_codon:yes gene_type:complete
MKVVDLHGVRYGDVYGMLENLCIDGEYPFVVITGNSQTMKSVVEKVVSTFGLNAQEKLGNRGRLIVCENR